MRCPGRIRPLGCAVLEWPGVVNSAMNNARSLLVAEDPRPVKLNLGLGEERALDGVVCGNVERAR